MGGIRAARDTKSVTLSFDMPKVQLKAQPFFKIISKM